MIGIAGNEFEKIEIAQQRQFEHITVETEVTAVWYSLWVL
jgi:hypothetical protein